MLEQSDIALELARVRHNGGQFRTPKDLRLTEAVVKRVVVTGACGAAAFISAAKPDFEVEYSYFGLGSELPDVLDHNFSEYDFHVAFPALRNATVHRDFSGFPRIPLNNEEEYIDFFNTSCQRLEEQIFEQIKYSRRDGMITFIANFFLPLQNPNGKLLPRYKFSNPVYFVDKLNQYLANYIDGFKNVYLLDVDAISASIGRQYIQDDLIAMVTHGGWLVEVEADSGRIENLGHLSKHYDFKADIAAQAVWAEVEGMYRTIKQIDPIKIVICDLDDTLWQGVSGEQDDVGPEMVEAGLWPYGVVDALLYLKNRGILLAISSKNTDENIRQIFPRIMGDRISLDDFFTRKINFRPKAENIAEILSEANLLPSNALFIDDNPVERSSVKAAFPTIRTLGSYYFYWRRNLLWSPELQVAFVTNESSRRTEMVKQQVQRDQQAKTLPRSEFLMNLELKITPITIKDSSDSNFLRAFELLNKTNQFNTTGIRWTMSEIGEFFSKGGKIFAFSAADKFTSYGLIAVALVDSDRLSQFVMSCRVGGVDVDKACIAYVSNHVNDKVLIADLRETGKNQPILKLYSSMGFEAIGENMWSAKAKAVSMPTHISWTDFNIDVN